MTNTVRMPGVIAGRLADDAYALNFSEIRPPLTPHQAQVAADRCYFCHDAPCIDACPTEIDVPMFIRQISTGAFESAARTIFDSNILGGMCARACPTEILCEQACVREAEDGNPVRIGLLQRFATDAAMEIDSFGFERDPQSGKHVAVIGSGPAGLACAHRLAIRGHDVDIFEARPKPGGLNEFGIATYKTVDGFAARELDWLLGVGGISIHSNSPIDGHSGLQELRRRYDAVFLGVGLSGEKPSPIEARGSPSIRQAVDFIAELRQAADPSKVPVGRDVVIIGGGMTAVDAAVQSRLLGAETVSIVYRNDRERMNASRHEQDLATANGVRILCGSSPKLVEDADGAMDILFERKADKSAFRLPADQLLLAIGQAISDVPDMLRMADGRYWTDEFGRTSLPGVWAGGDCVADGDNLTVTAVAQGRDAACDMHRCFAGETGSRDSHLQIS